MGKRIGFMTMGDVGLATDDTPTLGVGMLSGVRTRTNAYKTLDYIYTPPPAHPQLVAIAGRNKEQVEGAAPESTKVGGTESGQGLAG